MFSGKIYYKPLALTVISAISFKNYSSINEFITEISESLD